MRRRLAKRSEALTYVNKTHPITITKDEKWSDHRRIEGKYALVPAAEIRDRETGLVSGQFSWFQSRQIFRETHETEANSVFLFYQHFFTSMHLIIFKPTFLFGILVYDIESKFE